MPSLEIGDKCLLLNALVVEPVYVLGFSTLQRIFPEDTIFVIGDLEGQVMPCNSCNLRLMERNDIARARAKRLRQSFIENYPAAHTAMELQL